MTGERGSAAVETLLLVPSLILVASLTVGAGRYQSTVAQVRAAAHTGARSATLVSRGRMSVTARSSVLSQLQSGFSPCASLDVRTNLDRAGGRQFVRVVVACRLSVTGLSGLFSPRLINMTSSEVVDVFSFR